METNNSIAVFSNPDFGEVRTLVNEDGKVLFCGIDVATALGYAKPNNAISAHCRCALKQGVPHPQVRGKTHRTTSTVPQKAVRERVDEEDVLKWNTLTNGGQQRLATRTR